MLNDNSLHGPLNKFSKVWPWVKDMNMPKKNWALHQTQIFLTAL